MAKKPGTAYIVEVSDFQHEPSSEVVATGLFCAVHEPYEELLEEVPLSEALAWARARTPRV